MTVAKNDFIAVGSKTKDIKNPDADESNIFTAPVNGTYKWPLGKFKLTKRLKKGESIDLDKYKDKADEY